MKILEILFSVFGFLSVALGAFGAHALKERLSEYALGVFHTGVNYQFWHTLALGFVIVMARLAPSIWWPRAGYAFTFGILVFSGSLYLLAATGHKWLGAITPIGGTLFLVGWVFVFLALKR